MFGCDKRKLMKSFEKMTKLVILLLTRITLGYV